MSGFPNMKTGLRGLLAMAVFVAALVGPAQAVAQKSCTDTGNDPTQAQYCSVGGVTGGGGNEVEPVAEVSPAPTVESNSSSGSLPFTGLDVGILALVAAALLGIGLLLRRLTAPGVTRS